MIYSQAVWECGDCGDRKESSVVKKLNQYFINAIQVFQKKNIFFSFFTLSKKYKHIKIIIIVESCKWRYQENLL